MYLLYIFNCIVLNASDLVVHWFCENVNRFPNINSIQCHRLSNLASAEFIEALCKAVKKEVWNLKYLDISDNEIEDDQFTHLLDCIKSGKLNTLETFYLHSNSLTGITISPLCSYITAGNIPKLSEFAFYANPISKEDFEIIMKSFKCGNCPNVPYMKVVYEASKFINIRRWCRDRLKSISHIDLTTVSTPQE